LKGGKEVTFTRKREGPGGPLLELSREKLAFIRKKDRCGRGPGVAGNVSHFKEKKETSPGTGKRTEKGTEKKATQASVL